MLSIQICLGLIPDSIGNLSDLRELNLCNNSLTGKIPDGIANLQSLEDLKLFKNKLTGKLPDEVASFKSLKFLTVDHSNNNSRIDYSKLSFLELQSDYNLHLKKSTAVNFESWNLKVDPGWSDDNSDWIDWLFSKLEDKQYKMKVEIDDGFMSMKEKIRLQLVLYPQLLFIYPNILRNLVSAIAVINDIREKLLLFLRKLCEAQNINVLRCLVVLWGELQLAKEKHTSEERMLSEFADEIANIAQRLLRSNSLDDVNKLQQLILPRKYWGDIKKSAGHGYRSESYWRLTHILEENSLVDLAMKYEFKALFSSPHIIDTTQRLFWDFCSKEK